jgi:hypothetical protein
LRPIKRFAALLPPLVLGCGFLFAQADHSLPASPDFSQESVRFYASGLQDAWNKWFRRGKGLEDRAFRIPMSDARELARKSLGNYIDFLDSRRAYGQAVAAFMEKLSASPRATGPAVYLDVVCLDELGQLGSNLSALQSKLDDLRGSPQWIAIRAGVQADRDTILKLEGNLRAEYGPQDLSLSDFRNRLLMSSVAYRESEHKLLEALRRLWSDYYQALADAIEERPSGALTPIPSSGETASTPTAPDKAALSGVSPLVGVWAYVTGSLKFNGVAEPSSVLLELWMENGTLQGRYRAVLPDFSGDRKIDLRLHASAASTPGSVTLLFKSTVPDAAGELIVEGPAEGGTELMLVRKIAAQGPIPRGREVLHRQ